MIHAAAEELNYFKNIEMSKLSWLDYVRSPREASAAYRKEHHSSNRRVTGPHSDRKDSFLLSGDEIAAGHLTIEKSPQYTTFGANAHSAAFGLHQMMPSAKLIVL
jgi:hypothetical protein